MRGTVTTRSGNWHPAAKRPPSRCRQPTPEQHAALCREGHARKRERDRDALRQVHVDPFRERFLLLERAGAITRGQVAQAMGWVSPRTMTDKLHRGVRPDRVLMKPDASRVSRTLGIAAHSRAKYVHCEPAIRDSIPYDLALRLADVLGLDPMEAGI